MSRRTCPDRLDLGPDDDLLAEAEEARFLGDDLVLELGPRDLELVFGVEDGVFEVLPLEFRDLRDGFRRFTFFFRFSMSLTLLVFASSG